MGTSLPAAAGKMAGLDLDLLREGCVGAQFQISSGCSLLNTHIPDCESSILSLKSSLMVQLSMAFPTLFLLDMASLLQKREAVGGDEVEVLAVQDLDQPGDVLQRVSGISVRGHDYVSAGGREALLESGAVSAIWLRDDFCTGSCGQLRSRII